MVERRYESRMTGGQGWSLLSTRTRVIVRELKMETRDPSNEMFNVCCPK